MNAAALLVRCLEHEGVRFIFGVPGEETLELTDALLDARIQVVATRPLDQVKSLPSHAPKPPSLEPPGHAPEGVRRAA